MEKINLTQSKANHIVCYRKLSSLFNLAFEITFLIVCFIYSCMSLNRKLKIQWIFLLITSFLLSTTTLKAQYCDIHFGFREIRGCAPFRVAVKKECYKVDSVWVIGRGINQKFPGKGDSIVFTIYEGANADLPTEYYFAFLDSSGKDLGYTTINAVINDPNPGRLSSDTISLYDQVYFYDKYGGLMFGGNFGDGTSDYGQGGVFHMYTDTGTFHIKSLAYLCTDTQKLDVYVKCPSIRPYLYVPLSSNNVCVNEPVRFNPNTIEIPHGNAYDQLFFKTRGSLVFIFDDTISKPNTIFTRSFANIGDYPVTMRLTDVCGQVYDYHDIIHVVEHYDVDCNCVRLSINKKELCPNEEAVFSYVAQHCCNLNTKVDHWDLGDGFVSKSDTVKHAFSVPGTYPITLVNGNGCIYHDTVIVKNNNFCDVTFIAPKNPVLCPGKPVDFGISVSWDCFKQYLSSHKWDFGDGTGTGEGYFPTVQHVYEHSGKYRVSIETKNKCGNSIISYDTINVTYLKKDSFPEITFLFDSVAYVNNVVQFTTNVVSLNYIPTGSLNLGDGHYTGMNGTNIQVNPDGWYGNLTGWHSYENPGTYTVILQLSNKCGGMKSFTRNITVLPEPVLIAPWKTRDVGTISPTSNAYYSNGIFTLKGSGTDIWSKTDAFRYVYQKVKGNCDIVARLTSIKGSGYMGWSKAGVMIRELLTTGAKNAFTLVTPANDHKHIFQRRILDNDWTSRDTLGNSYIPVWLRINRIDNKFSSYYSTDSITWIQIGKPVFISMGDSVYIGLAFTSHNNAVAFTATFDHVKVQTSNVLPVPWVTKDVGTVGVSGNASFSNDAFTLNGSGADIWSKTDAFRYVYQPITGNCDILARLTSIKGSGYMGWTKAGVMIRESLAAGAKNAFTLVTPASDHKHIFQRRILNNDWTSRDTLSKSDIPVWLRLNRVGNSFTSFFSYDSVTWTQIGKPMNINMGLSAYVGLAISSHNNAKTCAATFDRVLITGNTKSLPWSQETFEALPVSIWPNPANDRLNIQAPSLSTLYIKDINGKSVFNMSIEPGITEIPLKLPASFYIVRIIGKNHKIYTTKLTIDQYPKN